MNDESGKIKKRILVKIYTVWFLRRILPLIIIQVVVLALALKIFAKNLFVSMVLKNAAQAADAGYWIFLKYLGAAFLETRPLTQIIILIGLGVVALIIRDIIRSLFAYKSMRIGR